MGVLFTKREVAELLDKSPRWVDNNASAFGTETAEQASGNGRRPRLYDLESLPSDAQRDWQSKKSPQRAETGNTKQLAAALTTPTGPNLSAEDRIIAERKFAIIEPLVAPERFPEVWAECGQQVGAVMRALVLKHGVKRSTVYHWLKAFENGGLPALVNKDRADKGKPRSFNNSALEFILAAAMPLRGSYGMLSVREIFRAYGEERIWREAHVGKRLSETESGKYARYLDADDKLSEDARLPEASYPTFNRWYARIPTSVKVMARKGTEAFANTQEILSFRNLTELSPLDYVVMDHRQLDIFCLDQQPKGWKLVRPWLTAAIDMRTRKWLGWVIVEGTQQRLDSLCAEKGLSNARLAHRPLLG